MLSDKSRMCVMAITLNSDSVHKWFTCWVWLRC